MSRQTGSILDTSVAKYVPQSGPLHLGMQGACRDGAAFVRFSGRGGGYTPIPGLHASILIGHWFILRAIPLRMSHTDNLPGRSNASTGREAEAWGRCQGVPSVALACIVLIYSMREKFPDVYTQKTGAGGLFVPLLTTTLNLSEFVDG